MLPPESFSIHRVASYFDTQDFNYLTDNDGDIHITINDTKFLILALGSKREVLSIQGQWHVEAPLESRGTLFEFINKWHAEKLFPKAHIRMNEAGNILVNAEVNTDFEHGVTDQQLELHVDCGLNSILSMFKKLDELNLEGPDA